MTTINNIDQAIHAEIANSADVNIKGQVDGQDDGNTLQAQQAQANDQAKKETANRGKPESELRAAARRKGYTLKELAALDGRQLQPPVLRGQRP